MLLKLYIYFVNLQTKDNVQNLKIHKIVFSNHEIRSFLFFYPKMRTILNMSSKWGNKLGLFYFLFF